MGTVDHENLGWVGCVNLDLEPEQEKILLVKNRKRENQIREELEKRRWPWDRHWKDIVTADLEKNGELAKKGKWELAGAGKIAWWEGNEALQKEFNALAPETTIKFSKKSKYNIDSPAQKEFLEKIADRVLGNEKLLLNAADATADDEFVQEAGLSIKEKGLVLRFEGKNKDSGDVYPKFLYLVKSAEGELRTESIKDTVSAPRWVKLTDLYVILDRARQRDQQFLVHASHVKYIIAMLQKIKEGNPRINRVIGLLEKRLQEKMQMRQKRVWIKPLANQGQKQEEEKPISAGAEKSWEELVKNVQPLRK